VFNGERKEERQCVREKSGSYKQRESVRKGEWLFRHRLKLPKRDERSFGC
jgi:hypothetical protein